MHLRRILLMAAGILPNCSGCFLREPQPLISSALSAFTEKKGFGKFFIQPKWVQLGFELMMQVKNVLET